MILFCEFIAACDEGHTYDEGSCRISCVGNDSCCVGKKCKAGEGDCDYDSECEDGLKCGKDNCLNSIFDFGSPFQSTDDCCYIPT